MNGITGSCNNMNCSFNYTNEQTPQLTSVSPSSGPGGPPGTGTVITLGGSGFSTINEENVVTIGGSECVIQTSAVDSITCRAGKCCFYMVSNRFKSPLLNLATAYSREISCSQTKKLW